MRLVGEHDPVDGNDIQYENAVQDCSLPQHLVLGGQHGVNIASVTCCNPSLSLC